MVFQSYAIWPHMTVFENVAYPLVIRHVNWLSVLRLQALWIALEQALAAGRQQALWVAVTLSQSPVSGPAPCRAARRTTPT